MSQAKVDIHKEQKDNRKDEVKRRKVYNILLNILTVIVCVAAVAWVGFSVYKRAHADDPVEYKYMPADNSMIAEYIGTLEFTMEE